MARIAVGYRHALALHRLSRLVAGREGGGRREMGREGLQRSPAAAKIHRLRGGVAQSVEQRPFKPWVVGSSPTALTTFSRNPEGVRPRWVALWPHRPAVRTRPFQGRDTGSSPVGVTRINPACRPAASPRGEQAGSIGFSDWRCEALRRARETGSPVAAQSATCLPAGRSEIRNRFMAPSSSG